MIAYGEIAHAKYVLVPGVRQRITLTRGVKKVLFSGTEADAIFIGTEVVATSGVNMGLKVNDTNSLILSVVDHGADHIWFISAFNTTLMVKEYGGGE